MHRLFCVYLLLFIVCGYVRVIHMQVYAVYRRICIDYYTYICYLFIVYGLVCYIHGGICSTQENMHRLFYVYLLFIYCIFTCVCTYVQVYAVYRRIYIDYCTCIYYLLLLYMYLLFIYYVWTCVCTHVQDRIQLARVVSVLPQFGDQTWVIRNGIKCLYILSYLSGLTHVIFI